MIYSVLTAIVFIVLIVGGGLTVAYSSFAYRRGRVMRKGMFPASIACIAVGILMLILIPGSFHTVEAGNVAVVKQMGVMRRGGPRYILRFLARAQLRGV